MVITQRYQAYLRSGLIALGFLFYALLVLALLPVAGPFIVALSVMPITAAGWLLGLRAALIAGLASYPFNTLLLNLGGVEGWNAAVRDGSALAVLALVVLAVLAGQMLNLQERMRTRLQSLERDANAWHENQNRLQGFANQLPEVVYLKDTLGRYVFVNRSFERAFGLRPADAAGKTDGELWPPETAQAIRANDALALNSGTLMGRIELLPGLDGMHEWLSYKFRLADPSSGAFLLAGMASDLTERQRREEKLQEIARGRARLEGVTLAGRELAHLLNNDLTQVMGRLEVLKADRSMPVQLRDLLRAAIAGLDAATEHIQQFQQVRQVKTKDTPVGLSLDLEKSSAAPSAGLRSAVDDAREG